MNQKITSLSLMLLVSAFALGQNTPVNNYRKNAALSTEYHLKASESEDGKNIHEWSYQKSRPYSHSTLHKSAQTIKQRLDSLIDQEPFDSTSQWYFPHKAEYTYDANNNMIQCIDYYKLDDTSQWIVYFKEEYTYDTNGNIMNYLYSEWDATYARWLATKKVNYTYIYNNIMTKSIGYYWWQSYNPQYPSTWLEDYKNEYSYDENNILTFYVHYHYTAAYGWREAEKYEYTYDINGNLTQIIGYLLDLDYTWLLYYKGEFTYNANDNIIEYLENLWHPYMGEGQWVAHDKTEYTYDTYGNPLSEIHYKYNEANFQLSKDIKYNFSYDLSCDLSGLILPLPSLLGPDYSGQIVNKPIEYSYYYWNDTSNVWIENFKGIYYYSEQNVVNVINIENENIILYPNPVSEYLNFSFTSKNNSGTFELFDIQGRKLISKKITNNEQLNLKYFDNGLYLYNLYIDSNRQSGKLIKE